MDKEKLNILYDTLVKLQLVELVMKSEDLDLTELKKVKEQIKDKLKESSY